MASALGEVKHNAERAALGTLIDGIFKDLKNKENKSIRQASLLLGLTEDGAQKKLKSILNKLKKYLQE